MLSWTKREGVALWAVKGTIDVPELPLEQKKISGKSCPVMGVTEASFIKFSGDWDISN